MEKRNIEELINQYEELIQQGMEDAFCYSDLRQILILSGESNAEHFPLMSNSLAAGYMIAKENDSASRDLWPIIDQLEDLQLELEQITGNLYTVVFNAEQFLNEGSESPAPEIILKSANGITRHLERNAADLQKVIERLLKSDK